MSATVATIIIANALLYQDEKIAFEEIMRMLHDWQRSRNSVVKFPILMEDSQPTGYVEPNEIKGIIHDYGLGVWKIDIFTSDPWEQAQHLMIIKNIHFEFVFKQEMLIKCCMDTWNVPFHLCLIIIQFAETEPDKINFDEKHLEDGNWVTNDKLQMCCKKCTIFTCNEIISIVDVTDDYLIKHKKSQKHLKAIEKENTFYSELENWDDSECDNDNNDTVMKTKA